MPRAASFEVCASVLTVQLVLTVRFGGRGVVESLQGVAAALLHDVIEVQDEHHDHALFVLHRNDMGGAEEL